MARDPKSVDLWRRAKESVTKRDWEQTADLCEQWLAEFGSQEPVNVPAAQRNLAIANLMLGDRLFDQHRYSAASGRFDAFLATFGGDQSEFGQRSIARALLLKGLCRSQLNGGPDQEAIANWRTLTTRFAFATDPEVQGYVARAREYGAKGTGRSVTTETRGSAAPGGSEIGNAPLASESTELWNRATALGNNGKPKEAAELWGQWLSRFGPHEPQNVVGAHRNLAIQFRVMAADRLQREKYSEAIVMFEAFLREYGEPDQTSDSQAQVASALLNKGYCEGKLTTGRSIGAIAAYTAVINRFSFSIYPDVLETVARARSNLAAEEKAGPTAARSDGSENPWNYVGWTVLAILIVFGFIWFMGIAAVIDHG